MMTGFYTNEELKSFGFKSLGENVYISRKASIYKASAISIGNNVRIDDFCHMSGNISIGDYVHIAPFCSLVSGDYQITMGDFAGLSSRCMVYATSDDYSGDYLTNPMLPMKYRHILGGDVVFEKHALTGTGSTVLPGVTLAEGACAGSMSLVNKSLEPWSIYVGIPCKKIKQRSRKLLDMEKEFMSLGAASAEEWENLAGGQR